MPFACQSGLVGSWLIVVGRTNGLRHVDELIRLGPRREKAPIGQQRKFRPKKGVQDDPEGVNRTDAAIKDLVFLAREVVCIQDAHAFLEVGVTDVRHVQLEL